VRTEDRHHPATFRILGQRWELRLAFALRQHYGVALWHSAHDNCDGTRDRDSAYGDRDSRVDSRRI
jgi:hypothetical protein